MRRILDGLDRAVFGVGRDAQPPADATEALMVM